MYIIPYAGLLVCAGIQPSDSEKFCREVPPVMAVPSQTPFWSPQPDWASEPLGSSSFPLTLSLSPLSLSAAGCCRTCHMEHFWRGVTALFGGIEVFLVLPPLLHFSLPSGTFYHILSDCKLWSSRTDLVLVLYISLGLKNVATLLSTAGLDWENIINNSLSPREWLKVSLNS